MKCPICNKEVLEVYRDGVRRLIYVRLETPIRIEGLHNCNINEINDQSYKEVS